MLCKSLGLLCQQTSGRDHKIIFKYLKGHSEVWEDLFFVISGSTVGVCRCSYMKTEASMV